MQNASVLTDVQTREDIEQLMRAFYEKALVDEILGPKFEDMDMEEHIPKIINFWQSTSIGGAEYNGSPFGPQKILALEEQHFQRWLFLFEQTIRERHDGPIVEQILQKAQNVANMLRFQLGLM